MISISAPTYDINGCIRLPIRVTNPYQGRRRGSVTATLDGGVSVYDTGYSDADITLSASWSSPTRLQLEQLRYLIAYYAELIVCVESGCFKARCAFALNKSTVTLTMRLLSRLDG